MKCTKEDTEKKLKSILQGEFLVSFFNACTFENNKKQLYYDDEYDDDGERLTIEWDKKKNDLPKRKFCETKLNKSFLDF